MNERINELRLDAGISQLQDDPRLVVIDRSGKVIDPLVGLEKFAQLLIQECALMAFHNVVNLSSIADAEDVEANIKQHFGVEE